MWDFGPLYYTALSKYSSRESLPRYIKDVLATHGSLTPYITTLYVVFSLNFLPASISQSERWHICTNISMMGLLCFWYDPTCIWFIVAEYHQSRVKRSCSTLSWNLLKGLYIFWVCVVQCLQSCLFVHIYVCMLICVYAYEDIIIYYKPVLYNVLVYCYYWRILLVSWLNCLFEQPLCAAASLLLWIHSSAPLVCL